MSPVRFFLWALRIQVKRCDSRSWCESDMAVNASEPLCQPCVYHEAFKGKSQHHIVSISGSGVWIRLPDHSPSVLPWTCEDVKPAALHMPIVSVHQDNELVVEEACWWWSSCFSGQWICRWRDLWCPSSWVQSRWAWRCCVSAGNWISSSGRRCSRLGNLRTTHITPTTDLSCTLSLFSYPVLLMTVFNTDWFSHR